MSGVLSMWKRWWGPSKEDFKTLYQQAIRLEAEGKLEEAIQTLQKALDTAHEAPHIVTTLEQHLRLPHLLFRVGRLDEAREKFEALLARGYPGQLLIPSIEWIERGMVHNAMRLEFERADRPNEAAIHGALSFIAKAYGQYIDSARSDYEEDLQRIRSRQTHKAIADAIITPAVQGISPSTLADILGEAVSRFDKEPIDQIIEDAESRLRKKTLSGNKTSQ